MSVTTAITLIIVFSSIIATIGILALLYISFKEETKKPQGNLTPDQFLSLMMNCQLDYDDAVQMSKFAEALYPSDNEGRLILS